MQVAAQLSLAALLILLPHASSCDPSTCNQSADATSLELLQVVANVSANRGAARGALAPSKQFPFGDIVDNVRNALPDSISSGLNSAALESILSLLNSTLQSLSTQADQLATRTEEYKDQLLGNVSNAGDRAIETLQTEILAQVPPVQNLWHTVSGAVTAALPAISSALGALGLEDVTTPVTQVITDATTTVDSVLGNATTTISSLSNATTAEKDAALAQLNSSIASGLQSVTALQERLTSSLQGMLASIASAFNVTSSSQSATSTQLSELTVQVDNLVTTLTDSLRSLFGGTLAAARAALSPSTHGGASALAAPLWLLAALVVSWF